MPEAPRPPQDHCESAQGEKSASGFSQEHGRMGREKENTFLTDHGPVKQKREVNAEVGRRFDAYLERLSHFVQAPERTEDEQIR